MQLADDTLGEAMTKLSNKLGSATTLLHSINSNGSDINSRMFAQTLRGREETFPSALSEFAALKNKDLQKASQAKKTEIKDALKEDISPLLAEAKEAEEGSKLFLLEELPTDPDECVKKLDELKATKKQEIKRLEQELDDLDMAQFTVGIIKENTRKAAFFDDAVFASMPSAPASSQAKKPKFG